MSKPLSNAYTPLDLEAGNDTDGPYSGPSPSYPGAPPSPGPFNPATSTSSGPFRPAVAPLDHSLDSQLAFYRDELNYVRQEHQKALAKIEEWKRYENNRLRKQIENRECGNIWAGFIVGICIVILITFLLNK